MARGRAVVVALCAVVAAAGLGACLAADDESGRSAKGATTSTVPPDLRFAAPSVAVESMRAEPVAFPDDVRDDVLAALNAWLDAGVVDPVVTGQTAGGLDAAFTPTAAARMTVGSADAAAMLEEGGATGRPLVPEKASASLVGLADSAGQVALVTAAVDVSVRVGDVRVSRVGEVVLMPVPGGWRIDSYDVVTRRDTVAGVAGATGREGR